MDKFEENLIRVQNRIHEAAARSSRNTEEITLLAVSKTWPVDVLQNAARHYHIFAENKVQEAVEKIPRLPDNLEWHFIGHLQSNKIRKIVPLVDTIHSVDSTKLALGIDRIAGEMDRRLNIYLQVNIANETAKSGFAPERLRAEVGGIVALPNVRVSGLMLIPPIEEDADRIRHHFAALREFRDRLCADEGVDIPGLSMGMSHDYPLAIAEGATVVRVGSALFGPRNYSK